MPTWLFHTTDFPPRWYCGKWSSLHGWTHIVSDVVIWGAYMTIPIALLLVFYRRRSELPYPRLFALFAAFIFCCGSGHLLEAVIFWHPVYRFAALVKLSTAVVSVLTVAAILPSLPGILALRSPLVLEGIVATRTAELTQAYAELEDQNTEQQRLLRALSLSNAKLRNFAYIAAHDLKAPIRSLIQLGGFLDQYESLPEAERKHYLALMKKQAHFVEAMIQGLFEYSRMGQMEGKLQQVDLGGLLEELLQATKIPAQKECIIEGPMPTLTTLEAPLKQCLQNLIFNAIQHGGSEIRIGCRRGQWQGKAVHTFEVSDDGEGIPEAGHEKIFELFRSLKSKDEGAGSGVGLAIVKQLSEELGGGVELRSAPGQGATFFLHWPDELSHFPLEEPTQTAEPKA